MVAAKISALTQASAIVARGTALAVYHTAVIFGALAAIAWAFVTLPAWAASLGFGVAFLTTLTLAVARDIWKGVAR